MPIATLQLVHFTEKNKDRFFRKVNKDGPIPRHRPELGPCWVWLGCKNKGGYGRLGIYGTLYYAHRVTLTFAGIEIPDGLLALHHCDNPSCVRPSHIFTGTDLDNSRDKFAKGRFTPALGVRNARHTHPETTCRGVAQWQAKLTDAQVIEIRSLRSAGGKTLKEIGDMFGVSLSTVWLIAKRKHWAHIP